MVNLTGPTLHPQHLGNGWMDGWMDGWIVGWMDLSASDLLQYMYCCRPTLYLICCTLVSTCISPHYHFTANYFWHTIIAHS